MKDWVTITGSSNGIGYELAKICAREEHPVILNGRNTADLENAYEQVISYNVPALIIRGDLRDKKTIEDILFASKEKDICLFINNVGYRCPGLSLNNLASQQIMDMLNISLEAPIRLSKGIYEHFLKKGEGTIINMNSIASLEPKENRSVYTAVRYGLRGFTESFRIEAKKNNVHVMGIYPTRVKTKPEFEYGWEVNEVCEKIYSAYKDRVDDLILDHRPEKYRPASYPINARVHLLNS